MIRRVGVLLAAGLTLAACGATVSSASALRGWVSLSGYHHTSLAIVADARHAVHALQDPSTSP